MTLGRVASPRALPILHAMSSLLWAKLPSFEVYSVRGYFLRRYLINSVVIELKTVGLNKSPPVPGTSHRRRFP